MYATRESDSVRAPGRAICQATGWSLGVCLRKMRVRAAYELARRPPAAPECRSRAFRRRDGSVRRAPGYLRGPRLVRLLLPDNPWCYGAVYIDYNDFFFLHIVGLQRNTAKKGSLDRRKEDDFKCTRRPPGFHTATPYCCQKSSSRSCTRRRASSRAASGGISPSTARRTGSPRPVVYV